MLQECEEVQCEGKSNMEGRKDAAGGLSPVLQRERSCSSWRLQKLVNKEIERIIRPEGDEEASDEEKKKKGGKGSNVNRLMKNRLQKLITTTDETYVP